jgi:hypothetical protein
VKNIKSVRIWAKKVGDVEKRGGGSSIGVTGFKTGITSRPGVGRRGKRKFAISQYGIS